MKKFLEWIKSPKSDLVLFLIVLILVNLVSGNAFFRLDLTSPKSYSLSKSSKQLVKTLEEPLSVKVFFSDNLPSPYNTVEQYLKDILVEYKASANKNFSYEFFDMSKPESEKLANGYKISQKQIQEVKDNEVGFKNVYMGLALCYADNIEVLDEVLSSDGLEYTLTTTIGKMITTTSALSGLSGQVNVSLYYSKDLDKFNIRGASKITETLSSAVASVNKKNLNKLVFQSIDPHQDEIDQLCSKYGFESISWQDDSDKSQIVSGKGLIAAIIEYNDSFNVLPVKLSRNFFGQYEISGLNNIEETISENLESLVSRSDQIGYLSGFGTKSLTDERKGSARFSMLIEDKYKFLELDLQKDEIPPSINNIVINGATETIPETVLYKLDQFLLRGGNLTVFADSYTEIPSQNQYSLPTYEPIETGLDKFLQGYGVVLNKDYVMDMQCYEENQRGQGKISLYYCPVIQRKNLNQKNPITKNLSYVLMFKPSSVNFDLQNNPDLKGTVLAKSSDESWTMSENIILHPMFITPPAKDLQSSQNLAVLVEGKFQSQYDADPNDTQSKNTKGQLSGGTSNHLKSGIQNGKIIVVGTSNVTTSILIDETGSQPIAIFVRNIMDYMNGNSDLCAMRTKGLPLNTLNVSNPVIIKSAKIINQYFVPLLVVIAGIIVWRLRVKRRRAIRAEYGSTDERETMKIEKPSKKIKEEK